MAIINRRDKSPETAELVRRRIQLARSGVMRPHWNKNLGREIYIPRRQEEDKRREIKRIDIQLRRKIRESHIGGGYLQNFGDEIPQNKTPNNNNKRKEPKPKETQNPPLQTTRKNQ